MEIDIEELDELDNKISLVESKIDDIDNCLLNSTTFKSLQDCIREARREKTPEEYREMFSEVAKQGMSTHKPPTENQLGQRIKRLHEKKRGY